jgi:hypothetical protein
MKNHNIIYFLVASSTLLHSCNFESENLKINDEETVEKLTFEQRKDRHITGSLSIDATEKYTTEIFKEKINNDEFEDAIITVNRFEFAKKKSAGLKNANQIADMGYLGNYNYFVFYDGKLDKFSVPVPVPSSPINKLKVKFENLSSEKYKDLIIEYRVLNA